MKSRKFKYTFQFPHQQIRKFLSFSYTKERHKKWCKCMRNTHTYKQYIIFGFTYFYLKVNSNQMLIVCLIWIMCWITKNSTIAVWPHSSFQEYTGKFKLNRCAVLRQKNKVTSSLPHVVYIFLSSNYLYKTINIIINLKLWVQLLMWKNYKSHYNLQKEKVCSLLINT